VITLDDGDLSVDIVPARGLDLAEGRVGGTPFSWGPRYGLMFTCGLGNVGVRSEGQPQHGNYRELPAHDVEATRNRAKGRVADGALELTREITVSAAPCTSPMWW
jgi:hypothetical protein